MEHGRGPAASARRGLPWTPPLGVGRTAGGGMMAG